MRYMTVLVDHSPPQGLGWVSIHLGHCCSSPRGRCCATPPSSSLSSYASNRVVSWAVLTACCKMHLIMYCNITNIYWGWFFKILMIKIPINHFISNIIEILNKLKFLLFCMWKTHEKLRNTHLSVPGSPRPTPAIDREYANTVDVSWTDFFWLGR